MAKINKQTLSAQSVQKTEQAGQAVRFATLEDQNRERTRAAMFAGLGSDAQLRGDYGGAGQAPRDMSRYSQGLIISNPSLGTSVEAWRKMKAAGVDPASYYSHRDQNTSGIGEAVGTGLAEYYTAGGYSRGDGTRQTISPEQAAAIREAGPAKNPLYKTKKNKQSGELEWVDKDGDGQPDLRGNFQTIAQLADKGQSGAIQKERAWEVTGQIVEVEDAFAAMRAAAEAGDFTTADAKYTEAMALVEQYGLNERFDPSGLKGGKKGPGDTMFSVGNKYDPLADTSGEVAQALGSPTGMLVGKMVNRAEAMQDPNSEESIEFKRALSEGAYAAIDGARKNAMRSLAGGERGAARAIRDMGLQAGQASAGARQVAIAARSSERFATQRAGIETNVGAAKAQVFSDTAKAYEAFRVDFAKDATALASAWVNDQSGVRDSFRAMQMNMAMNWSSNLMGFASQAQNNATRLVLAELGETDTGGWAGAAGGAIGGATAGAAAGPWGALAGGVVGGVAGYFS